MSEIQYNAQEVTANLLESLGNRNAQLELELATAKAVIKAYQESTEQNTEGSTEK